MRRSRWFLALALLALCGACGSPGSPPAQPDPVAPPPPPPPPPPPVADACSISARGAFILARMEEWYLFPELLNRSPDPATFSGPGAYLSALVAPARAAGKDRFFSGITSIAEENAFFEAGASGGFGFRLGIDAFAGTVFVLETFEGTSALAGNIDRGSEILEIGTQPTNLVSVSSILATRGRQGVTEALGPETPGTARTLRLRDQTGAMRLVTLTKTTFNMAPVSPRYGVRIIEEGGRKVGYLNLRTFIEPAEPALRDAFARFRHEGVRDLILDLRYNGGGALSVADLLGNLLASGLDGSMFYEISFRPEKAGFGRTTVFAPPAEAIAPRRIAFLTSRSTASASELVIAGLLPYLPGDIALIGDNTFGKPVGQIALDLPQCDDRLRPVSFRMKNANGNGDYFSGLAGIVPDTCHAFDDWRFQLGAPGDPMVGTALAFLSGARCAPIATSALTASTGIFGGRTRAVLAPDDPQSVARREVPGLH